MSFESYYLNMLKDRINLRDIPFTDRGSRLLVYRDNHHLSVRLAERWFKRDGSLSAYRRRPPIIDNWCFTDENGNPLEFILTTNPHRLDIQTAIGQFSVIFLDTETLLVLLPAGSCGLQFNANMDQAAVDRRGGVLHLTGDIRRNISYTTNAKILRNEISHVDTFLQQIDLQVKSEGGKAVVINITPRLGFNRYIPDAVEAIDAASRRWHDWFAAAPEVLEQYQPQYYFAWWVMRAGLISTRYFITREAMTPSKMHYVGVWQWDAYFHALAYRHIDKHLAQDQIRILLDHQREDGMLPDAVHDEGVVTHLDFPVDADVTKPPLVAWAAWKLFEKDHDVEFLNEIYEPLSRWNEWWFEKNDRDKNGLCEYGHPYSSGLDDSPLWDDGMPVEAPDLNTYLCLQEDNLGKIARAIGDKKGAAAWSRRAANLADRMIRIMWDEEAGLFWAFHNRKRVNVVTPFNLFPLITGRMPPRIADRLVHHLTDERQFWSPYPVPSVAMNDPKFNPDQMWRGPTWVNINYLLVEGLERAGYTEISRRLCRQTLDLISQNADIYEYYNPQTGLNPPKAAAIFGWSSSVFIDLAIKASNEKSDGERKAEE